MAGWCEGFMVFCACKQWLYHALHRFSYQSVVNSKGLKGYRVSKKVFAII